MLIILTGEDSIIFLNAVLLRQVALDEGVMDSYLGCSVQGRVNPGYRCDQAELTEPSECVYFHFGYNLGQFVVCVCVCVWL